MIASSYLHAQDRRARLMRYDTAIILKRFHFVESSLVLSIAGWIPATAPLLLKTAYARIMWENSQSAESMRQRVFELRYPSRLMSKEGEEPLIQLMDEARNAPSALAFYLALVQVLLPALKDAYQAYLELTDFTGDGPSWRFMQLARHEKEVQISDLMDFLPDMLAAAPQDLPAASAWVEALRQQLSLLGGIGLDPVEAQGESALLLGRVPFAIAQNPAREDGFRRVRFYWPDVCVPGYPYGEGLHLQLRSAVSHLNEVWAVEACAAFTYALSDELGWEFVLDAARWTYDESRHCRMGYERLSSWGFTKAEMPLGDYIYRAGRDQDPIYRLGMLFFFETKNIHKKPERAEKFRQIADALSQHDMDFDWADETIHAHYGKTWLTRLLERRGQGGEPKDIRQRCYELVEAEVASATPQEQAEILQIAGEMIAKAERLAATA